MQGGTQPILNHIEGCDEPDSPETGGARDHSWYRGTTFIRKRPPALDPLMAPGMFLRPYSIKTTALLR